MYVGLGKTYTSRTVSRDRRRRTPRAGARVLTSVAKPRLPYTSRPHKDDVGITVPKVPVAPVTRFIPGASAAMTVAPPPMVAAATPVALPGNTVAPAPAPAAPVVKKTPAPAPTVGPSKPYSAAAREVPTLRALEPVEIPDDLEPGAETTPSKSSKLPLVLALGAGAIVLYLIARKK